MTLDLGESRHAKKWRQTWRYEQVLAYEVEELPDQSQSSLSRARAQRTLCTLEEIREHDALVKALRDESSALPATLATDKYLKDHAADYARHCGRR